MEIEFFSYLIANANWTDQKLDQIQKIFCSAMMTKSSIIFRNGRTNTNHRELVDLVEKPRVVAQLGLSGQKKTELFCLNTVLQHI